MNGAADSLPSMSTVQGHLRDAVNVTDDVSNQPEPSASSVEAKLSQIIKIIEFLE